MKQQNKGDVKSNILGLARHLHVLGYISESSKGLSDELGRAYKKKDFHSAKKVFIWD